MAAYTIREIDDELWYRIKALAALRGMSIKDFIIGLLKKEVKEFKGE